MAINARTVRRRSIRELVLRVLYNCHARNPDVAVLARHIYSGFSNARVQFTREEIDAELVDLLDDRMIAVEDAPSVGPMADKAYRTTSRGRDFYDAGCPWAKIDEFTGGETV